MTSFSEVVATKLVVLKEAIDDMETDHASMLSLQKDYPQGDSASVHATSLATHIQGIFTGIESIIGEILKRVDGTIPGGGSSHRELLAQACIATEHRPRIIGEATRATMTELLGFRHVVRKQYGSILKPARVFENREHVLSAVARLDLDVATFIEALMQR